MELHDIDRFSFLVGSPVIATVQCLLIFTLCRFRLYRSSPLDIVLICFVSELVLNLSFFSNASTAAPTQFTTRSSLRPPPCPPPSRPSVTPLP